MKIEGNKIIYADHKVVCDPSCADEEYVHMMAESLSVDGSMHDHRCELHAMNNDGTWKLHRLDYSPT